MNALEAASLVMIPSGYENGTLGSLKPLDGTGDFTFSRGSDISATRVNEDGYIEKGYENLLLQSNQFDTTWVNAGSTITDGQLGYDGSNNAWLLESTNTGQSSRIQSISQSGVQTASVYAKAGTTDWMFIYLVGSPDKSAWFNLSSGSLGNTTGIDSSIESVGNGWYRCSVSYSTTISSIRIYVSDGNNNVSSSLGANIYIQDAMINQGMVSYPYVETTTAPVAGGILEDMPRLDYSDSSCSSVLLEPQRTNLIPNSEYFMAQSWASKSGFTTEENTKETLSPEGYYNATKFTATTTDPVIFDFVNVDVAPYTFTFYAKGKGSTIGKQIKSRFLYLSSATGANQEDIFTLTSDWQRFEAKTTPTGAGDLLVRIDFPAETAVVGDEGYLYGAQVEQGSYPTSYIPTYGTSQTRLEDDLELPTLSSVFDSTGSWTMFFELERMNDDSVSLQNIMSFIGTQGNFYIKDRTTAIQVQSLPSFQQGFLGDTYRGDRFKIAIKFDGTRTYGFFNGTQAEISEGANPQLGYGFTQIQTNRNHKKYQEIYFPTALSDDECIELTTI